MLPSLRDQARVVLCPDRVVFVRLRRGLRAHVEDKQIVTFAPAEPGEPAWGPALAALKELLDGQQKSADALLILSNHFVRYVVVPWSDELVSEQEQSAFVRHRFTQVYGELSRGWAIVVSNGSSGVPRMASAIDQPLLDAARGVFATSKIRLRSVQPYLMSAFNQWRHELKNGGAWFLLAESDRLCLALLHHGQWHSVRTRHIGPMLGAELPLILDQERLLSGLPDAPSKVLLHVPNDPVFTLAPRGDWATQHLKLESRAGFSPYMDAAYSMAMSGDM